MSDFIWNALAVFGAICVVVNIAVVIFGLLSMRAAGACLNDLQTDYYDQGIDADQADRRGTDASMDYEHEVGTDAGREASFEECDRCGRFSDLTSGACEYCTEDRD